MSAVLEMLASALLVTGGGFACVGAIGLARLGDFYKRLHGPTKASTLGVGGVLLGAMLWQLLQGQPSLRELLVTVFLFLTAPVSAHLLAKAALALDPSARPPRPPADADGDA